VALERISLSYRVCALVGRNESDRLRVRANVILATHWNPSDAVKRSEAACLAAARAAWSVRSFIVMA
jgi:hypothetical protein